MPSAAQSDPEREGEEQDAIEGVQRLHKWLATFDEGVPQYYEHHHDHGGGEQGPPNAAEQGRDPHQRGKETDDVTQRDVGNPAQGRFEDTQPGQENLP
jgi:hypothetical protein